MVVDVSDRLLVFARKIEDNVTLSGEHRDELAHLLRVAREAERTHAGDNQRLVTAHTVIRNVSDQSKLLRLLKLTVDASLDHREVLNADGSPKFEQALEYLDDIGHVEASEVIDGAYQWVEGKEPERD